MPRPRIYKTVEERERNAREKRLDRWAKDREKKLLVRKFIKNSSDVLDIEK